MRSSRTSNCGGGRTATRWSDEELAAALEAATPLIRLVIMLCLYTGQRIGDVLKMRWDDINHGVIGVTQQKTGHVLVVPVHPKLSEELPAVGSGYIVARNAMGDKWLVNSIRQRFVAEMSKAGLSHLKLHGLRKTFASRLAEGGATTRQIMAIGGWKRSTMVDLYTAHVDQERLAREAILKLEGLNV